VYPAGSIPELEGNSRLCEIAFRRSLATGAKGDRYAFRPQAPGQKSPGIRHRQDASPAKMSERPRPYRWMAISGTGAPFDDCVTARTVAPGRGPPTGELDASGGSAAHCFPDCSGVAAIRMIG